MCIQYTVNQVFASAAGAKQSLHGVPCLGAMMCLMFGCRTHANHCMRWFQVFGWLQGDGISQIEHQHLLHAMFNIYPCKRLMPACVWPLGYKLFQFKLEDACFRPTQVEGKCKRLTLDSFPSPTPGCRGAPLLPAPPAEQASEAPLKLIICVMASGQA